MFFSQVFMVGAPYILVGATGLWESGAPVLPRKKI